MNHKEAQIKIRKQELELLCQDIPELSAPIIHYIGARLSQHEVQRLAEDMKRRGLEVEVVSKGHEVRIQPKYSS